MAKTNFTPITRLPAATAIRKPVLATNNIEQECVDCLRDMLRQAETGELIGFAIAAMYKKGNYTVNSTGEVYRSPTFALGMLAILKNHFVKLVLK